MADNVLNLSAFGEVIEPNGKREYKKDAPVPPVDIIKLAPIAPAAPQEKEEESSKSNLVASAALKHMAQTKLLHWQTESYSEHKALDKLFDKLVGLTDTLVESTMGKYGRPKLTDEERKITVDNYINPEDPDGLPDFMDSLDKCYRTECYPQFSESEDPEILNIIQEILSLVDQTKYLLSLKK